MLAGAVAVLVVVAWAGIAAWQGWLARSEALEGLQRAERAGDRVAAGVGTDADLARVAELLAVAGDRFRSADDRLHGWWSAPVSLVPVARTQLAAARSLTGAATAAVGAAADVVGTARDVRDGELRGERLVEGVEALHASLAGAAERLDVDLGRPDGLVGPLAEARARADSELTEWRGRVGDLVDVTATMGDLLRGPRHYLLVAANSAEMHAGMGAFLSIGGLRVADGSVDAEAFSSPTDDRTSSLPEGAVPVDDPDLTRNWDWMQGERIWVTLGATPRFDANARVAADMWEHHTGEPVDGVIVVDAAAMGAVLAATGPLEVDGQPVDPDDVVADLLYEQYGIAGRADRRDRQQELTDAAVAAVSDGAADPFVLAEQLGEAARGRHVLAWSRHAPEQEMWEELGVDGRVPAAAVLPSLMNLGATKLDPFIDVEAEVRAAPAPGGGTDVAVELAVRNRATGSEHDYVVRGAESWGMERGSYFALFSLVVPGAATDVRLDGDRRLAALGPDGDAQVVASWVTLPAGGTDRLVVRFSLPPGHGPVSVEPSARIPGVRWRAGERTWRDDERVAVALDDLRPLPPPAAADSAWVGDPAAVAARLQEVNAALGPLAAVDVDLVAGAVADPDGSLDMGAIADVHLEPLLAEAGEGTSVFTTVLELFIERRLLEQLAAVG